MAVQMLREDPLHASLMRQRPIVHQCAWCLAITNGKGRRVMSFPVKISGIVASHGICLPCKDKVVTEYNQKASD